MKRLAFLGLLIAVLAMLMPSLALAQDTGDPNAAVSGLLEIIQSQANGWDARLRSYATGLFWSLAVIQFVVTFFPLAIRTGDVSEIFGELIRFVLTIGFFAALMLHSREWASAIVDSFREAGASAGGLSDKALRPGDIFGVAVDFAQTIGDVETWNPLTAISVTLAALVVLLSFTFIAALMFVSLVESYIVINASVLFMGFGGSSWTREYAIALLRYALSVGAKLFVLTLIVGIVLSSTKQWQAAYNVDDTSSMWTMVGLGLICAYLAKTIPDLIQGLISGVSPGGGNMIGSMAMIGTAIATAGASAAAGAMGAAGGAAAGGAAGGAGVGGLLGGAASGSGGLASALSDGIASSASSMSNAAGGGSPVAAASLGQRTGGGASAPPAAPASSSAPAATQAPKGPSGSSAVPSSGNGAATAQNASQERDASSQGSQQGATGESSSGENSQSSGISAAEPQSNANPDGAGSNLSGEDQPAHTSSAETASAAEGSSDAPSGRTGGAAPNTSGGGDAQKGSQGAQQQDLRTSKGHLAASGALKVGGALAALAVPGMEGAASLSLGPTPMKPVGSGAAGDGGDSTSDFASTDTGAAEDNVISPARAPIADTPPAPSPAPPPASSPASGDGTGEDSAE